MHHLKTTLRSLCVSALATAALLTLLGCRSNKAQCCSEPGETTVASAAVPATPPAASSQPTPVLAVVRINVGSTAAYTDSNGNSWLPDQGFVEGEVIERADLPIANTQVPEIYRTERYSMQSFSHALPNGKYTVKLHFAETFEGITGAGERVFSFDVEGQEYKDFDVFAKAGGAQKAFIQPVKVDIADGKLDIRFTSNIENPQINGIEITPGW